MAVIASEGGRLGRLIDDLLAFARLGRQPLQRSHVDMEDLARTVFAELAEREPGRTLRLSLEPIPPARGDPSMLRQVWVNLLSNAIKYTSTREVAQISIGSRTEGGEITYWVQDNGVGFDMKYAGKLFGVFQRLHSEAEFSGTGVGLALVQRILQRHDGRIWADARIDAGATFFFTLPQRRQRLTKARSCPLVRRLHVVRRQVPSYNNLGGSCHGWVVDHTGGVGSCLGGGNRDVAGHGQQSGAVVPHGAPRWSARIRPPRASGAAARGGPGSVRLARPPAGCGAGARPSPRGMPVPKKAGRTGLRRKAAAARKPRTSSAGLPANRPNADRVGPSGTGPQAPIPTPTVRSPRWAHHRTRRSCRG